MNRIEVKTFAAAFAALAAAAAMAHAEDAKPEYPDFAVTFGGSLNDGNTEDESGSLAIDYKNVRDGYEYILGANGVITRTSTEKTYEDAAGGTRTRKEKDTTAKNGELKGKVLIPVADPFSAYIDSSLFADEIADIDYRFIVGPGVAWNVVKTDTFGFALELGVSPMWERMDGCDTEYYTMLRVGERMEKTFANGSKIWESAEYLPALNDSDKYLVNAEAGAESPLNERLSLRVVLKDKYNSVPAEGSEKNDLSLTVGVSVRL